MRSTATWPVWPVALVVAFVCVFAGVAIVEPQASAPAALVFGMVAIAALWLYSPSLTLLSYVAVRPLADLFVYQQFGGIGLGQAWGGGLLVLSLAYLLFCRRDAAASGPGLGLDRIPAAPLFMILGYAALTLTRPDPGLAAVMLLRLTSWVMLALVVERIAQSARGQVRVVRAMAVYAVLLVGVVAYLAYSNQYGAAYYSRGFRYGSGVYETLAQRPGGLAAAAVFTLPVVLLFIYAWRRQLSAVALAALLGLCVVLSYRRTAYLSLAIVVAGYSWIALVTRSRRLRTSLLVLMSGIAVALYFSWSIAERRFAALLDALGGNAAILGTGGRVEFWRAIVGYNLTHPWQVFFGGGAHASLDIIGSTTAYNVWAHNDFLEMLASGGLVLLFLYVWLLVWMARSVRAVQVDPRQTSPTRSFAALALWAVAAFVVYSFLTGVALSSSSLAMGVLIGLVRGMSQTPGNTAVDVFGEAQSPREASWVRSGGGA